METIKEKGTDKRQEKGTKLKGRVREETREKN